ncbi:Chaperonin Cpn60/GroEL/TCP-1 family [Dillenia turbinata]|uniref:1-phosphatidylinositol-3-phosphate 5-kinase n=1 Tax=Dillenia turbinata TaxID=194707 RepID=A0AAN8UAB9_9MAGN
MDSPDKRPFDLIGFIKSWIPWRTDPAHVSRDFWMPDQSCRVCYECDAQFTIFNRRHHCRLCGRVFCAKCTSNSVPAPSDEPRTAREEWEKIRVCNYCFKQWKQCVTTLDNVTQGPSLDISTSPSETSFLSTKSGCTAISSSLTLGSVPYSIGTYQRDQYSPSLSPCQSAVMDLGLDRQGVAASGRSASERSIDPVTTVEDPPLDQFGFCANSRSDDEDDEYGGYHSDSEARHFSQVNDYYGLVEFDDIENGYRSHKVHPDGGNINTEGLSSSPLHNIFDSCVEESEQLGRKEEHDIDDETEAPSSLYAVDSVESEPVDFENNGVLWLPPDPEDEEDEREAVLFDDDDDGATTGEWGYLRCSSCFGSGECRSRDRSSEEHKKAMKNIVDGHFRALIAQLLQVENVLLDESDGRESWLDIITALSWEAATLLKPDMSKGGGMDPGGYVKVKCIARGHRCESMVVKGVVCKKNVAHRRMTSRIERPCFLILGGALEYQRVSNLLSSFDTLLQQEMDHLKMAVAKIDARHPDILLVEKSVSRFAQEYLLAKGISLVLNVKRPLLERIARCTGAHIVPSIDHLSSQKLGYCDMFHVEKYLEEHGSAGQGGKKLVKTLMYFEGCPKPLGCTVLLKGASGDELKKLKHVVQYGVFAAYHLALETSFLADEGASLPELPLQSPINVALPDKPSTIERSISTIPGFSTSANDKPQGFLLHGESERSNSVPSDLKSELSSPSMQKMRLTQPHGLLNGRSSEQSQPSLISSEKLVSDSNHDGFSSHYASEDKIKADSDKPFGEKISSVTEDEETMRAQPSNNLIMPSEIMGDAVFANKDCGNMAVNQLGISRLSSLEQDNRSHLEQQASLKEEFPPSPSDHQSILVSLSTRCVWRGTVCERAHLFRIKYYGSFDKPLGRFLRDHLFDQSYRCRSCEMPSEAHVHCYTHRQGTLTISVKKLPEILLPGEREGKIWMWHRCLQCPRAHGFPPATRRIVMSDAAWGLSFGKFLELSFSNHAAASRVASCGHSLHRDCLRFYGFGKMVACFRYASIDVHSVYLPPPKLDFKYENGEWVQKETNEVVDSAELLFSEVLNALRQIQEEKFGKGPVNSSIRTPESRHQISELEVVLQKEKAEFEDSLHKILSKEVKRGKYFIDILEINRLRWQLLVQSYVWDHLLVYASKQFTSVQEDFTKGTLENKDTPVGSMEEPIEANMLFVPGKGFSSCDSYLSDAKCAKCSNHGGNGYLNNQPDVVQGVDMEQDLSHRSKDLVNVSPAQSDPVKSGAVVRRALSEGEFPIMANLSDTLDAAWTGENPPGSVVLKDNVHPPSDPAAGDVTIAITERLDLEDNVEDQIGPKTFRIPSPRLVTKAPDAVEELASWLGIPFVNIYRSFNRNLLGSAPKFDKLGEYNPVYISSFRDLELQGGARMLLPVSVNGTVIPVFDDEPTSIISYVLLSKDYHDQLSDEWERPKDGTESSASLPFVESQSFQSNHSFDETASEMLRGLGSIDESILSMSGSRSSMVLDPLLYLKALHARVSVVDNSQPDKVKYTVTCYYAKRFEALRRICCPSELDFVRSLSRCKKWGAQGGKSNVFFAKTLDDRFIIKQVTKTELESFIKFAPEYFKYLSESISSGSPTCLAKILGIYQVTAKHLKGGKESRMDVLVMENLLFRRNVTRLYDLKGSSRSRYNPDSTGSNKVLLDQNLIEAMPTSPIFVGNKAKRLLERAVWNDTAFLASIDVMDYSLLVGVDEEKHELVLGIIDFMRQYTWDKHLETWVKASGILGGLKNASPTVISPKQYKKRFRKAMSTYFLMVPDQWSPPTIVPSRSLSDFGEENTQGENGTSAE